MANGFELLKLVKVLQKRRSLDPLDMMIVAGKVNQDAVRRASGSIRLKP